MSDTHSASRLELSIATPLYMAGQGTLLGGLLGALTGTLIFPIVFSLVGLVWGMMFGGIVGGFIGTGYALMLLIMGADGFIRAISWVRFLASFWIGVLFFSINIRLLDVSLDSQIESLPGLIALLFALAFIATIACVYATDNLQTSLRSWSIRKLKHEPTSLRIKIAFFRLFELLTKLVFRKARGISIVLAPVMGLVITLLVIGDRPSSTEKLFGFFTFTIIGLIYFSCQIIVIASWMTSIIMVANRYLFTTHTDPHIYKRNLSILTFCLVLPSQLVIAAFIGAPIAAIIATLAVRDYADWVHSPEKAKRLQKSGKKRDSQSTPSLEMPILEAEASTQQTTQ